MFPRRVFPFRNRQNLWDSSDDEDNNPTNIEAIDLSRLPGSTVSSSENSIVLLTQSDEQPSLSPPSSSVQQQQTITPYVPHTLQQDSRRYSILPAFPTSFYNNQTSLLLPNVPIHKLNQEQLTLRRKNNNPPPYTINKETYNIDSYFRSNYQEFISSLIYQYNVDESILDYNLYRFSKCFRTFSEDFIRRHKCLAAQFDLTDKQKQYALEFYLQIDVDLFFMKTCSFRNAKPRSDNEGLFCIDEPDVRYGLSPCNKCSLCVPSHHIACRQQQMVRFGPGQKFRFVNGYQTILNCPAECHTRNIIYVMTCPCGDFEYIGETSQRLSDRLCYHRQHANRIIHEFLIGEENVKLTRGREKDGETLTKDRMLLYKHAARCPCSMQIFLNFNPIYCCFVPMTTNEAKRQNRDYIIPASLILLDAFNPTSIGSKDRRAIQGTMKTRSDEAVRSCMRHVPEVPSGYTFSTRQRIQQFQYFKDKLDIKTKQEEAIHLFNAAIIAVLPVDASETVRRFVESLFITHTEAKLNTSGRLLHEDNDNNDSNDENIHVMSPRVRLLDRGEWCRNIVLHHFQ